MRAVYEYQLSIPSESLPSPTSDTIARFEDLYQRELPGIMRSKLELIIDEELRRISERIKSRVPEIVRSSQEEFLQRFQHHDPASSNVAEGYFGESERCHLGDHVGQLSSNFGNGLTAQSPISKIFVQPPPILHEQDIHYLEGSVRGIAQERASSWNLSYDSGYNSGATDVVSSVNNPSLTQDAEMAPPFNANHWSDHAGPSYFGYSDGAYM